MRWILPAWTGLLLVSGCAAARGGPEPAAASSGATAAPAPPASDERVVSDPDADLEARLRSVVTAQGKRLRGCDEEGLDTTRTPVPPGRVVLVLEVGTDGHVTRVSEARREGLSDEQVRCFARVLKETLFHDGAARAVRIQVPLSFTPLP